MDNEKINEVALNEADEIKARKEEIKKEDSNKIGLFLCIILASGLVGGILGASGVGLAILFEESGVSFIEFWNQLQKDFSVPAGFLLIIFDIFFCLISFLYLRKAKKLWKTEIDEDDKYEIVDRKLSWSMLFSTVAYFVNFAFFGFVFYAAMSFEEDVPANFLNIGMRPFSLFVFVITLFVGLAIQKGCINHSKLMNPEKKGSVYDMKFDKVWYESCDEAERVQIGIASYKAVKATNMALLALLVVFVLGGMFFEIGILPIVVITIIALVINITYSIAAIKAGANCGSGGFKM